MFRQTFGSLVLGLLAAVWPASARAAEQTNLVEILRAAMAPPDDTTRITNKVQILAPGDLVELTVYQEDDLNLSDAVIAADGTVSHRLLGPLAVGGKTLEEARAFIHDVLLKDYLVNPQVTLTASYRIIVVKEVVRPETYKVSRNVTLTLMDAIARAGGPTRDADMSRVTVRRTVNAEKKELKVDAETPAGKAFGIQANDVIEVPPKGR